MERRTFIRLAAGGATGLGIGCYYVGDEVTEETCLRDAIKGRLFPKQSFYERTGANVLYEMVGHTSGIKTFGDMSATLDIPDLSYFNKDSSFTISSSAGNPVYEFRHLAVKEITGKIRWAATSLEDKRFYEHGGISLRDFGRALWENIMARKIVQGGSTITMQLAKMIYDYNYSGNPNGDRTYERKKAEIAMAAEIEKKFPKDDILKAYLNIAYFGNGVYGFENAAQIYLGKSSSQLTSLEAATLISVVKSPTHNNPFTDDGLEKCMKKATKIYTRAFGESYESEATGRLDEIRGEINSRRGSLASRTQAMSKAFYDYILKGGEAALREAIPSKYLADLDVSIKTTIDSRIQESAQANLEESINHIDSDLSGAVVVLKDGEVKAIASTGRNGAMFNLGDFNMATQARRQPGSTFKPFTYILALINGWNEDNMLNDYKDAYQFGRQIWSVDNYGGDISGEMTVREALVNSNNRATAYLAEQLHSQDSGFLSKLASFIQGFGFRNKVQPYPSTVLGATEVTPLELATAFSVFANNGVLLQPSAITGITVPEYDANMRMLSKNTFSYVKPQPSRLVDPEINSRLTSMLVDVVEWGTGTRAQVGGVQVAGKTGTSQNNHDAWFAGYTPDGYTIAIWVGYDSPRKLPGAGGTLAAPICSRIVSDMRDMGLITKREFNAGRVSEQIFSREIPAPNQIPQLEVIRLHPTEP